MRILTQYAAVNTFCGVYKYLQCPAEISLKTKTDLLFIQSTFF